MITEHHYTARRFVRCTDKHAYRQHMCGLCHALGDTYGLANRLLTTHDAILLNLLTSAQREQAPAVIERRCPLNPLLTVQTNHDNGSAFAAAASVGLAYASAQDDQQDEGSLKANLLTRLLRRPATVAAPHLSDITRLRDLTAAQAAAEQSGTDPAAPTASVSAQLFAHTATLASLPANTPALAQIGTGYGAYIYYADAYRDLANDVRSGAFNPLARFTTADDTLNPSGQHWLQRQLTAALDQIQAGLYALILYRDRATLERLLTAPLNDLIAQVTGTWAVNGSCGCNITTTSIYDDDRKKRRRKSRDGCCGCCECGCECCCEYDTCCSCRRMRGCDDCDCDCD